MSGWLNLCNTVPDSSRPGNRPILKFTKYVYQVLTYYKAGRNLSETRLSSDVCRVSNLDSAISIPLGFVAIRMHMFRLSFGTSFLNIERLNEVYVGSTSSTKLFILSEDPFCVLYVYF